MNIQSEAEHSKIVSMFKRYTSKMLIFDLRKGEKVRIREKRGELEGNQEHGYLCK